MQRFIRLSSSSTGQSLCHAVTAPRSVSSSRLSSALTSRFGSQRSAFIQTYGRFGLSMASFATAAQALHEVTTSSQPHPEPFEYKPLHSRTINDPEFSFQTRPENQTPPSTEPLPWSWSSPKEQYVYAAPLPPSSFVWPQQVEDFCRQMYRVGYDHESHDYNPHLFLPFQNSINGKNEYETFVARLPGHPETPCPTPDLSSIAPAGSPLLTHPSCPDDAGASSSYAICHVGPFGVGPPQTVHGGLIASLFDVVSYRSIAHSGRPSVTANLNIDYRAPIPIGHPFKIFATARFPSERKSIVSIGAFSDDLTKLYAEASAVFVVPKHMKGKARYDYSSVGKVDPLAPPPSETNVNQ